MSESQWELILGDETTSCGNWLVSCTTLVKVSKYVPGQVPLPKIRSASACDGSCAMAVDQTLVYLSKDQELTQVQTKTSVDELAILDGGYLVMGLSNGALTIGLVQTDGDAGNTSFIIKSSQKVMQCDSTMDLAFKRVTFELTGDQVGQVVALTTTGSLIVVSNIKLMEGDINVLDASVTRASVPKDTLDCVKCGDYFVLLGQGQDTISLFSLEENELELVGMAGHYEDKRMTGIWACGSHMFLTLDTDNVLHLWNLSLCIVVESLSLEDSTSGHAIVDLLVTHYQETNAAFDLSSVSAAVLSEDSLQVLQFPSLGSSFQQAVDTNTNMLLTKSPLPQDDIYVTQCAVEYDEDDDETCLHIKFLSYAETDPQRRLEKLLARHQFDDAQRLIDTYKIQFNITPYLVQQQMYQALPTLIEMEDLLKSCRKRIDASKPNEGDCDQLVTGVSSELHALKYRLDVFAEVFGQKAYSPSKWQQFQQADILDVIITLFTSQQFQQAFDLWHAFQLDLIPRLKPGMVGKILHSLTTTIPKATVASPAIYNKVLDWLVVDIVPRLVWLESLAHELVSIVQWTLTLVEIMESQRTNWPLNGIEVCDRMLKAVQTDTFKPLHEVVGLWLDEITPTSNEDLTQALEETLTAMRTINVLKTRFHCHLSLDVVRKETKESIVYRMLDNVKAVESLPKVLQTQILPYVEYSNIQADVIFASYVKDIMQRVSHNPFDDLCWQTKVQAIIDVIATPKEKVQSILNLVEHSKLPFADFVEGLVTSVLETVKHPLSTTLQTQWQTLQASNLLCLYGMEPFSVTPNKALQVARHFILQDRPSSMSDAMKFLQAVGVDGEQDLAQYQAMFYIENDRLPDLKGYIKSLPSASAKSCSQWCVGMAEMTMTSFKRSQPQVEQVFRESRMRFLSSGIMCVNLLKHEIGVEGRLELEEIKKAENKLNSAYHLESRFNIGLDRFDLEDTPKCLEIFKKEIEGGTRKEAELMRIAELLGLRREVALCCMLEHTAVEGTVETVCHLTQKLCECPNLSRSSCIYDTALRLAGLEEPRLLTPAKKLATHALINCHGDEMASRLKLTKEISVLERVYSQCQADVRGVNGDVTASSDRSWSGMEHEDLEDWFGPSYSPVKMPLTHSHLQDTYKVVGLGKEVPVCDKKRLLTELASDLVTLGHEELTLDLLNHVQQEAHQAPQQDHESNRSTQTLVHKASFKVSARLLTKVIKQSPSDIQVCLPLTLQLPQSHMVTLLNQETKATSAPVNHSRLKKLLTVATAYGEIHSNDEIVRHCQELSCQEKWRNRLSKLGLSLGPSPGMKTVLQMMTTLMMDHNISFPMVQEFACDMNLDPEAVQQEYRSTLCSVLSQAPVSPDAMDKAELILQSMDESNRLEAVLQALPITNEYNYEVLQFLLEQKDAIENNKKNEKALALLKLLKEYKRKFPPSSIEEDAINNDNSHLSDVFSSFSNTSNVPTTSSAAAGVAKMAAWERQQQLVRLPFRLLQGKKMSKIMEVELNLSTLPVWQLIASALGLPKDSVLISLATKLMVSYTKAHSPGGGNNNNSGSGNNNNSGGDSHAALDEDNGVVTKDFENLLQDMSPILFQMERRECGVWLCQATADKLTRVGDKVMTLENGLNYARMWMEEDGNCEDREKAEKAAKVFEAKIPPLSTQWALIRAGLGSRKELMPLINQPEQLVRRLYHLPLKSAGGHIGIGKFDGVEGGTSYDEAVIHSVCEEIAELHDLDLLTIQKSLIDLWLTGSDPSASSLNDAELTMFNVTTDFDLGCDSVPETDSLPRIVSMLKSFHGPSHVEHLLEILFCNEDDSDVTIHQLQHNLTLTSRRTAILCLFITGHASPEMRRELTTLNQLISLQTLGLSFTPDVYSRLDKLPLLLRVWDKYKGRRSVGPLVSRLCLDLSLNSDTAQDVPAQLWDDILSQMVKEGETTALLPLMLALVKARGVEKVRRTNGFLQAKRVFATLTSN